MQYLAVFACLVAAVSANMWGHNGGNMGGKNMPGMFQNLMSGMGQWNQQQNQQNHMNMLQQLLQGHMNQNQMSNQNWNYGGQQYQQRPQQVTLRLSFDTSIEANFIFATLSTSSKCSLKVYAYLSSFYFWEKIDFSWHLFYFIEIETHYVNISVVIKLCRISVIPTIFYQFYSWISNTNY